MIKSIQKIKGLGVFNDYAQPVGTDEFGIKNVIYGWNYSGKTTLSRLISLLEHKRTNPELPNCKFNIATDAGTITEDNFHASTQIVRVFNSDFVTENLNFSGSVFKPILLLGTESEAAQREIDRCEALLQRCSAGAEQKEKETTTAKKAIDKAKSDAAANIKATISLVSFFGATQLDKEIAIARHAPKEHTLSPEALDADLKLARTSDQEHLPAVRKMAVNLTLPSLYKEAMSLFAKKPDLDNTIDYLVKNPAIEAWIESGLPLHDNKDTCEFCGNALNTDRLQAFREHFSKDLANHKQYIQRLIDRLEQARLSINEYREIEFNVQFRKRFTDASEKVQRAVEAYNKTLEDLITALRAKLKAPFSTRILEPMDESILKPVENATAELNAIIEENNKISNHFPIEKDAAIKRLKLHYAQTFIERENLDGYDKRQKRLDKHRTKYLNCAERLRAEVGRLKAIISQAQRGREEINKRIQTLLGSNSVQIAIVKIGDEERFQLVRRNGKPAKHLSEGEKTAIAFSFFLTKLQELKDLSQAVVFIDDPISSLDSNHIFQVTAIIKAAFFYQDGPNGEWKTRCRQIFFSTHNFEFFSLLRELKPCSKKGGARHYLVKRISPTASTFGNMPSSMLRYSSEYHFLFGVLNDFHQAANKSDFNVLMLLPNAVRRFVELYTYSRYPDQRMASVDERADRIFGAEKSKRILKVLHYFSHANNIERIAENNDLICDIEGAVSDLMALLEEDQIHLQALKAAVA
jgi:wobble nucleotide-excising tRNase